MRRMIGLGCLPASISLMDMDVCGGIQPSKLQWYQGVVVVIEIQVWLISETRLPWCSSWNKHRFSVMWLGGPKPTHWPRDGHFSYSMFMRNPKQEQKCIQFPVTDTETWSMCELRAVVQRQKTWEDSVTGTECGRNKSDRWRREVLVVLIRGSSAITRWDPAATSKSVELVDELREWTVGGAGEYFHRTIKVGRT